MYYAIDHTKSSHTIYSLPSAEYELRVTFSNYIGVGTYSPWVAFSVNTTLTSEDTPTFLEAAPHGFGTIAVLFNLITSTSRPIDGYKV